MTTTQAKQLNLPDILAKLGHQPVRTTKNGNERWYKSPFRQEAKSSFHTSFINGKWIWNDFGDSGGNVIDFILRHQNTSSVSEALTFLDGLFPTFSFQNQDTKPQSQLKPPQKSTQSFPSQTPNNLPSITQKAAPSSKLIFLEAKPLASKLIFSYLKSRKIPSEIAKEYLALVRYRNRDRPSAKPFFAFGQQNIAGGWEIRSAADGTAKFKSALIKKDITVHPGSEEGRGAVSVFEGMLDHLSLLVFLKVIRLRGDVIILNSLSSYESAKAYITSKTYTKIDLFLDNNAAGQATTATFSSDFPGIVTDRRKTYEDFPDLNDALIAGHQPVWT
jgi:hypothetical protein